MTPLFGLLQRSRVALATLALTLGACAGDDTATGDTDTDTAGTSTTAGTTTGTTAGTGSTASTTTGTSETSGTTSSGAVTYDADIQPIWDLKCVTGCHAANGSNPTLLLGKDMSYDAIVGVMSSQVASLNIVEPGDTDKSYLWHKINGSQADVGGMGLSMPFGTMLDAKSISTIETWINDGAKP